MLWMASFREVAYYVVYGMENNMLALHGLDEWFGLLPFLRLITIYVWLCLQVAAPLRKFI